jgi:hypothetical protein
MLNLKPKLREGEAVLGEYGATVYFVHGNLVESSNRRLWLTNQRLILRAALPPQRTLPLYAIANFREEKVAWYTAIRLEFTNGHIEWLTVQNQAQFLEALRSAQAQAPEIPEEASPATTSPAIRAVFGGIFLIIAVIAVCFLLSAGLFAVVFGVLWFLAQGG